MASFGADLGNSPAKGRLLSAKFSEEGKTYSFRREIALEANRLAFSYSVTNLHPKNLIYTWAFHPPFRAESGMSIELRDRAPIFSSKVMCVHF
jgi:galactose mutarotase-like enzyme